MICVYVIAFIFYLNVHTFIPLAPPAQCETYRMLIPPVRTHHRLQMVSVDQDDGDVRRQDIQLSHGDLQPVHVADLR